MKPSNHRFLAVVLVSILLLVCAILPAHGETDSSLHLYLDIPFDTGTVEMVTDILAKEKNAIFEMNPNGVLTGYACNIEEYGYLFDLSIDFSDGQPQIGYSFESDEEIIRTPPAIERILLHSLQPARITLQEAQERIPAEIRQYLDMVEQMTGQYGQPDVQYFKSSRMNGKKYINYMFEDGKWDSALMQQVIDTDHRLIAYTVWGNVVLELDVDLGVTYEGVCISNIILYYYPADETADFQSIIEVYPIE